MYQSVLCLIALNDECSRVLERAQRISEKCGAELQVLHVVEYVPLTGTEDAMLTAPISIGDELEERARKVVGELADKHGVPADRVRVVSGDLLSELQSTVAQYKIDLVVVGNHSRKGLAAIFNHAEDMILHRSGCDLLAVQLD